MDSKITTQISASKLTKVFPRTTKTDDDITAYKDLSFHVNRGEFLCVLGPSGCGKSTLLRTIASLEDASAGELHIAPTTNNTDTNGDGIGDYCQCGDINGDGNVNNVDSILIKRADLGLSVGGSYNPALCDVNGDGNCNNVDSILIKRADLGLSVGGSFRTMCGPMP